MNGGKTRQEREQELLGLLGTQQGCAQIGKIYHHIKDIPAVDPTGIRRTLVRHQMIPTILAFEYPNERRK